MSPNAELESQVIESLQHLLARYESVNSLLDQFSLTDHSVEHIGTLADQIRDQMNEIERLENSARPCQQKYRESREHASQHVQEITSTLAKLMQSVLLKVGQLEKSATHSRSALMPHLQNNVKAIQMKSAYAQYQFGID